MKLATTLATALIATLAFAAQPAMASKRSTIKIINESSTTVLSIRSSPKYRTSFGRTDLLGDSVLRPGYYMNVDFDSSDAENECVQDILIKAANGGKWQRTVNVCTTTSWTLND